MGDEARDRSLGQLPSAVDVVVVGSGLGGLTAALDLARNGLSVCVLEQHRVPGGYAHGFRRKSYVFDVSLHHVGGLSPGSMIHGVLDTLGVASRLELSRGGTLFHAEYPDFKVALPNDRRGLMAELSRLFPSERAGIKSLFDRLEQLKRHVTGPWVDPDFDVPPEKSLTARYIESTLGDILRENVTDPRLLAVLGQFWMFLGLPPDRSTATFSSCVFSSYFLEGTFQIAGGGTALVEAMIDSLREQGGDCHTGAPVKRIIVEDGAAVAVETEGGHTIAARAVISNANPYQTFFDLIPGDEISRLYRYRLDQMSPSLSLYSTYIGLDCPATELGIPEENYFFNHSLDHADAYQRALDHEIERTDWCLTNYDGSPVVSCPQGKSVVSVAEVTPAREWLSMSPEQYREEKLRVTEALLDKYEARFPGLRQHAAVTEFASPRTMARYTRNHQGAVYGLAQSVDQSNSKRLRNRTPVDKLYLTGAWTWAGGGYEGAIMSGVQTSISVLREVEAPRPAPSFNIPAPPTAEDHFRFRVPVHVLGDDLNCIGSTNASAYLRFMDRGRVEAIEDICREQGTESWLTDFVVNVYRLDVRYYRSTLLGDRLEVRTGIRKTSSHRAAFDQRVVNLRTGEAAVDAMVEVLFLGQEKRLVPVPGGVAVQGPSPMEDDGPRLEPVPFSNEDHFRFRSPFRVYYEDTDAQGIAYHVSYVRFCERALTELFSPSWKDTSPALWMDRHRFRIGRLDIRYLHSAALGDQLEVRLGARRISDIRIGVDQRIVERTTGKVVADAIAELQFADDSGLPSPIPDALIDICS